MLRRRRARWSPRGRGVSPTRPGWNGPRAPLPADLAHAEGARARRPARVRLRPRLRLGVRGVRRVGIDVGGPNTDAVLLEGDRVVHAVKTPTTGDVTTGITRALDLLLKAVGGQPVHAVMIGTTHFTNAVVQRKGLVPV